MNLLKEINYDIIKYDAGDVRNKSLIDTITSNNISNRNVLQMMYRKEKNIAIVMDEIDGMNNGDKGGITSLIKLIRQKKTKKQKSEDVTLNPIICIGNYFMDKKIRELMKVCNVFELKMPTSEQITRLLTDTITLEENTMKDIVKYIQGDLRKLIFVKKIFSGINPAKLESFELRSLDSKYFIPLLSLTSSDFLVTKSFTCASNFSSFSSEVFNLFSNSSILFSNSFCFVLTEG
jgi:hypothetical protein